ncbi:GNAT family N-acetyltransferase [Bizionia myxarmorum]|uniref:GNAT family N-acetyltransferase n=1 Tax=Bizionia myxarmorum TaxID=291186 RepID=A0A5D0RCD3_9FLAO|nr:GNAT family N-acetyltransferase [Bizionia myxarmorum]TYB79330.1 GNAT family N-acetyltransferase [Bizionia myxarmorum]
MNFSTFPEIQTERLLLRLLRTSDWEAISYLRSDKDINKFIKRSTAESKEKAFEFIEKIEKGFNKNDMLYWAITHNNPDEMVGSVCLWNFSEDRKTAEVGYDLSATHQGKRIMDESLKSVVNYGFNTLNLNTIEAYTHKRNTRSKNLLKRNGFNLLTEKQDENNLDNAVYELKRAL